MHKLLSVLSMLSRGKEVLKGGNSNALIESGTNGIKVPTVTPVMPTLIDLQLASSQVGTLILYKCGHHINEHHFIKKTNYLWSNTSHSKMLSPKRRFEA